MHSCSIFVGSRIGLCLRKCISQDPVDKHEYRTFAYVVNYFKPGEIENYNWAVSTIAAAINSTVLHVLGFDEESLVQSSSAFSWRYIFYSEFGIRAGIIAGLYMAYGFPGACFSLLESSLPG